MELLPEVSNKAKKRFTSKASVAVRRIQKRITKRVVVTKRSDYDKTLKKV